MKENDYTALFSALNEAVEILNRNRSPDPAFVAAYDTLKQSRAMIAKSLEGARGVKQAADRDRAAA